MYHGIGKSTQPGAVRGRNATDSSNTTCAGGGETAGLFAIC
jgi:hypothetical protein